MVYIQKHGEHYIGFNVSGHAGYAPEGKDIVCAAVSALTITLENSLETMVKVPIEEHRFIDQEMPEYIFPYKDKTIDILMESYQTGIESLVEQYPKHVTLHLAAS